MKILIVGDVHLRGDSPRGRKGNYYEDCKTKLQEVFEIAEQHRSIILQVGDLFNSPNISYAVLSDFAKFLSQQSRHINAISGNHDCYGHNISTISRTAYGFLQSLDYIYDINDPSYLSGFYKDIEIIGKSFDHTLDHDYSEYITPEHPGKLQILVVHGMLLPHEAPFRHSKIERVAQLTNADVIISGHYHLPFQIMNNGKLFINPGALMRISATEEEMNMHPSVVLLDTDDWKHPRVIRLSCAKPGNEVLDRQHIEQQDLREENMQRFIESLDFTSEARFMDIQEVIERVAARNDFNKTIATAAMERISKVRESKK